MGPASTTPASQRAGLQVPSVPLPTLTVASQLLPEDTATPGIPIATTDSAFLGWVQKFQLHILFSLNKNSLLQTILVDISADLVVSLDYGPSCPFFKAN